VSSVRLIAGLTAGIAISGCAGIVGKFSGRTEACAILAVGAPAQARILRLIDTGTTINDDPVVDFVLEVTPNDGPAYEATARGLVGRLDVPRVQPGTLVAVKFDPQAPERVAIDGWDCEA
jgi:hypothetical protein